MRAILNGMSARIVRHGLLSALMLCSLARAAEGALHQWAQWRGPLQTGVAPFGDPPLEWSETKNVRWKTDLPGKGHSTPIVWGDRILLTTAVAYGEEVVPPVRQGAHDNMRSMNKQRYEVLAIDRANGKILWKKTVRDGLPHDGAHETASFASNSAVTDGEFVYAFFGSAGLYCLDFAGNEKWKVDLGKLMALHGHGEGNSPAIYGDTIVINWDQQGPSFIVALNKRTGKEIWRKERNEATSWSTPIIVEQQGKPQVIVSATNRIRGYDLANGDVIWESGGLSSNVVASPVAGDGYVYAGSSYEKRAMFGIKLEGAHGDITNTSQVVWSRFRDTPYVPSPLLYEDKLYFLKHYQGILHCLTAKTGEPAFAPLRLPEIYNVYASLVGAAGKVYITSREGTTVVVKHGAPEILATNVLDDTFSASPAIVGKEMFLRGEKRLYCLKKE